MKLLLSFFLVVLTASSQTFMGAYSGYEKDGSTVTVKADSSSLRLRFYTPEILRIDFLPSPHSAPDSSFVVIQQPGKNISVALDETDSDLTIASPTIRIVCKKNPLRLMVLDSTGRVLIAEPQSGGLSWKGEARTVRFLLQANDHFYGTGERGTSLDKRGQKFESYNTQVPGYSAPLGTMNLNVPFIATTNGYALYIDNTYKGLFDLGASDTTAFSYTAEGGELSMYLIAAPTIPAQLERYTWLTGRQPLPPRWAFGFIQSKNRYENEEEARSIVKTLREKRIPCDAIVLDLKWFKSMGDVSWNESLWPHHEAMVSDFLSQGMKTILITEPYIIEPSINFAEADKNGFLAKDSTGHTYLMDHWWSCGGICSSSLLDITNADARSWWWSKHPAAFGAHVAGIWTDLGEPERHPDGMQHALGSAVKVHNIYNLVWAKTVFEGFNQLHPGERVVNLTRSGFAGIQRYGVLPWSGDVARSFAGLEVQMPMLLNMGMSGIAYHNSDIGGYARMATTPELYVRWMQYGTFCPIARAHGAGETVHGYPTEPWMFGAEAETICRNFIALRYRLMPYIYTMAHENYASGLPLARPLFWSDPADTALVNESSSYMWGDAFLVSPVVKAGERTKKVYLPRGEWIDFWTDAVTDGGKAIEAPAPLDRMPIFVKSGSIVPMAQPMQYSNEHPIDTLTLRIYPSEKGDASYTLYEDDGSSLAYQTGACGLTAFTQHAGEANDGGRELVLTAGERKGTFTGALDERVVIFEVRLMDRKPVSVQCGGENVSERSGQTFFTTKGNAFCYDAPAKTLFVSVRCRADKSYRIEAEIPPAIK